MAKIKRSTPEYQVKGPGLEEGMEPITLLELATLVDFTPAEFATVANLTGTESFTTGPKPTLVHPPPDRTNSYTITRTLTGPELANANRRLRTEHPSHAIISVSRSNSSGALFGSPLTEHYTNMRLKISRAVIINDEDDGRESRYLDGESLIDVTLSSHQWAELLSTHNVMPGTPCTLSRYGGEIIEPPPPRSSDQSKIKDNFTSRVRKLFRKLTEVESSMGTILAQKKALTKADKAAIRDQVAAIRREVTDNLPFLSELFEEVTQRTIAAAKLEVSSAFTAMLTQTGISTLQEKSLLSEHTAEPQLPEKS